MKPTPIAALLLLGACTWHQPKPKPATETYICVDGGCQSSPDVDWAKLFRNETTRRLYLLAREETEIQAERKKKDLLAITTAEDKMRADEQAYENALQPQPIQTHWSDGENGCMPTKHGHCLTIGGATGTTYGKANPVCVMMACANDPPAGATVPWTCPNCVPSQPAWPTINGIPCVNCGPEIPLLDATRPMKQ